MQGCPGNLALCGLWHDAVFLRPGGGGGGGGGGASGGWGGGGYSRGGKSAATAANKAAATKAGGGSRSAGSAGWSIGSKSTSAKGSSLYLGQSGRARSGRPRYYGAGHSRAGMYATENGMSFAKKAILWSAVAGAAAFVFYSSAQRDSLAPDCPRGQFRFVRAQ